MSLRATLALSILLTFFVGAAPSRAQADPQSLADEMMKLMQQMQAADDPCPFRPKFKELIGRLAAQSPETYNAMKPALDLLDGDNSCAEKPPVADADQKAQPEPPEAPLTEAQVQKREDLRKQGLERQRAAEAKSEAAPHPSSSGTAIASRDPSGTPAAPGGSCSDVTRSVSIKVKAPLGLGHCDGEVVGYLTNGADGIATCTWAFRRRGRWGDYGMDCIRPGQTAGGEMGGIWTCGAEAKEIKYVCYAGDSPVGEDGKSCNANVRWTD